jgi:hypothetical protein
MAGRSLHWLNPRAHTVKGTGRIRRIQLRCPRRGGADLPCPHPAVRTVFVSWPEALRGGWAVVNSHKGPNGTPKPSSDVTGVGTRDRLRGASPTNGLWRRSTRSTPGAGLTAGTNRTRRARTCGEGVQASTGCPGRGACVMQDSAHVGSSHREGGAHGLPLSRMQSRGTGRARSSSLAGERSALKGACCVREGPAGKAHWACPRRKPGGCSLAGYLTLTTIRDREETPFPVPHHHPKETDPCSD